MMVVAAGLGFASYISKHPELVSKGMRIVDENKDLDIDGSPILLDKFGNPVTDESILKKFGYI